MTYIDCNTLSIPNLPNTSNFGIVHDHDTRESNDLHFTAVNNNCGRRRLVLCGPICPLL